MVKRALITGATGKIGRAVCRELADAGFGMALHYHSAEVEATKLVEELSREGCVVRLLHADLANAAACEKLADDAGDIDVLVHCASSFERTPFGEVSAEKFDEVIATEMRPAFLIGQAVGLNMRKRDAGSMIFFSDIAAEEPYINYLPYCMAKAGINLMVKAFAKELSPNVRVNAIAPGRKADPNKTAKLVLEVIESAKTGQTIACPSDL
jgi:pteridine reductase